MSLRDDVVRYVEPSYLGTLYDNLCTGEKFSTVTVHLGSIPNNESGRWFLLQFLGRFLRVGAAHTVARKKARIVAHWGAKMGIPIEFNDPVT